MKKGNVTRNQKAEKVKKVYLVKKAEDFENFRINKTGVEVLKSTDCSYHFYRQELAVISLT